MLGKQKFMELLQNGLFIPMLRHLYQWLARVGVDHAEVAQWFAFWKSKLPADVVERSAVTQQLKLCTDMMQFKLSHGHVEGFAGGQYAPTSQRSGPY